MLRHMNERSFESTATLAPYDKKLPSNCLPKCTQI